jgi:hypothetical protein
MQISGVSLALTWPCRLCLLRFLLCVSLCYKLSPLQALGKVTLHPRCQACMFIYSSRGKWVFPPLLWSFPPSDTLTSFPAPGCWVCAPAPARGSPARPACLFTVPGRIPFPQSSVLSAPHPVSHVSLLLLLLITQFLFFPWVEVGLSRGLCCSGPGLSVGVPCTMKLTWSVSSQAVWALVTGSLGALLVSLFNVKWRFSALAFPASDASRWPPYGPAVRRVHTAAADV